MGTLPKKKKKKTEQNKQNQTKRGKRRINNDGFHTEGRSQNNGPVCEHSMYSIALAHPLQWGWNESPTFNLGLSYLTGTFFRASCFYPLTPSTHLAESSNVVTEGMG